MAIIDDTNNDVSLEFETEEMAIHGRLEKFKDDFESDLDTLIGKYDQLVAELRAENAELKRQVG